MVYDVRYWADDDVLVIELSGDLSRIEDNQNLLTNITRPLLQEVGLRRVLFDFSKVSGRMEVGDAFFFARSLPAVDKRFRCALLEGPVMKEYAKFYEATARNSGHDIRVFCDRDTAYAWLRENN